MAGAAMIPGRQAGSGAPALLRRRADLEHDLFATIVEEASSEILVFDAATLTLLLANRSSRNNLGYTPAAIGELNVADIKAEFPQVRLKEIYRPFLDGETARTVVHTTHRRSDGTTYPVEVHSRSSTFEGRMVIFEIVIDQTEIKRTQVRAELNSLIERDAAEAKDSGAFLASLLARLCGQFKCQIAHAYVWKEKTGRLESSGIWHGETPAEWHAEFRKATERMAFRSGEGLPGQAHRRKKAVVLRDLGNNSAFARRASFGDVPAAVGFAIPVLVGRETAAVLEFFCIQDSAVDLWPELLQSLEEQTSRLYERKCNEERTNESRERFDAAVNGATVGLWDYGYKSEHFYLSPRCREILHIPDSEPSPSWEAFQAKVHPKDVKRTAAAMKAHMLKRTPYDVEYRYQLADGRYIWIHARARGVWNDAGDIVRTAGIIENISAEKEAEQVQREVLACIAAPGEPTAKITQALDRLGRYLNLPTAIVSHVVGDRFQVRYRSSTGPGPAVNETLALSDTICSDVYSSDVLQAFADLARSPAASHPARTKTGIESYIGTTLFAKGMRFGTLSFYAPQPRAPFGDAELAMVRLLARWIGEEIGRAIDVAELIENDARASSKLASAADALLTVDHNGRIEDANPAAAQMFCWSADDLRQISIETLLPTAKFFSHTDGRLIAVQMRQDIAVRKDGERVPVLLNISEIHVGGRTLYTVVISDLTKIKQAEIAKGEFVSIVSHELRTPLTSIRGALSLLANETTGTLTPENAKLAQIAQRNCERLLRLVNDILSIEKLESGGFEMSLLPLDVNALLSDAVAANALYAAKHNTRFQLLAALSLPPVIADGERLMQVMANLLSNAAKFTRPGTTIQVRSELAGTYVRICVSDHGQGIPENLRERIFEKFVQAENVNTRGHEGSGLGLSIARKMVELMNGEIGFTSQSGVGTTFTISLPSAETTQAPAIPEETTP
jgi:PAS domain S-box-containing protein